MFTLLALAVLFLTVVPVGLATFWLGMLRGDSPCVMCWEQRIGMLLIALSGLFILRFGPKPKYVGMAVLIAGWGIFMGMRHVGMHAARDIGQGFSLAIFGVHTYTWALFTYWVAVLAVGLLLLMVRDRHVTPAVRALRGVERWAGGAFLIVVAGNLVQAFASTGPPPFMGQSDPIRFSFNPRHWHWSLEEWTPLPISLRGRWDVDPPDLAALSNDPAAAPFANLPALDVTDRRPLGLSLDGAPTDLGYDPATDQFLITTARGVYLTDSALSRIERHAILDPGYSVDIGTIAGTAFLDDGALIAVGHNKSYVVLRPSDTASADANFRYFLESRDQFEEVGRGRFGTVRARLLYVQSAAYDPVSNSVYTATVPNNRVRRLVLSRFDRRDLTLSEEYLPVLSDSLRRLLPPERDLGEFAVTGAAIAGRRLYLLSAAYGTLLTVDLASRQLVAAYAIAGLTRPTGLALRGNKLYVVDDTGALTVVSRPPDSLTTGAGVPTAPSR